MPTPSGATDLNGAAAQLSALINSEQVPTEEETAEAQEEQAQEQEAKPETDQPEQETSESQEANDDTEAEEETYKVKVDGEELEVTLEELQKGYMMEANYRNKTTALNKERDAIDAKATEVDKQLEDAKALIDADLESLDSSEMQELKESEPDEYIRKYEKVQGKIKRFEALQAKRAEEHQARQEKLIEKERDALFDAFPEWSNDQDKMASESKELMGALTSLGFSQDELNGLTDHRMFVLAHKAQQLEKIHKANLDAKKVTSKPKTNTPGQPRTKEDRSLDTTKQAWAQLKKTGSRQAAMDLLSIRGT